MSHDFDFAAARAAPPAADRFGGAGGAGGPASRPAEPAPLLRRTLRLRTVHGLQAAACARALGRLPGPGEALHAVTAASGWYAWNLVPAVLELAGGARIVRLAVSTLSFSPRYMAELVELMDAGRVGEVDLLASGYFAAHNPEAFGRVAAELRARGGRCAADYNHAKVVVAELSDGRTVTAEGSANLRGCGGREQVMLTGDPALARFHAGWIADAVAEASAA